MANAVTAEERFWSRVLVGDGCWEWAGGMNRDGYGLCRVAGVRKQAHRVAYRLAVGPIPDGMVIDHLCRNRRCMRPAHLEAVTVRENTLRGEGIQARNARKTHCLRGHEFTAENTKTDPRGSRCCRRCSALHQRNHQMKKKKAAGPWMVRQGDCLIVRDDSLKPGAEIAPENGRLVLATGETSGHCHAIDAKKARLYALAQGEENVEAAIDRCLIVIEKALCRVESTTSRAHQDERHTPIELPPGNYRVRVMREYDPRMLRSVAD